MNNIFVHITILIPGAPEHWPVPAWDGSGSTRLRVSAAKRLVDGGLNRHVSEHRAFLTEAGPRWCLSATDPGQEDQEKT